MDSQLKPLVAERGTIKMRLTLLKKFVETGDFESGVGTLENRAKLNEGLYERFDRVQSQIELLVIGTELEDVHIQERDAFETTHSNILAEISDIITRCRGPSEPVAKSSNSSSPAVSETSVTNKSAPLPTINVGTFNGDSDQWIRFRDTFLSLVHNREELTNIQRFHYLANALTGPAALVLGSLGVSAENYQIAWGSLKDRYEDPKTLLHNHLESLLQIPPIAKPTSLALRILIDTAKNHIRAIESLLSPAAAWDALVGIHVAKKLDNVTYDMWENHVENFPHQPKLQDVLAFLEKHAKKRERKEKGRPKTDHAHNVESSPRKGIAKGNKREGPWVATSHVTSARTACPLCNGEHALHQCAKFRAYAISEKYEAAKRFQCCFNCLQRGHRQETCTRGSCRKCGKTHHSLLHRDAPIATNNAVTAPQAEVDQAVQSYISNTKYGACQYTVLSTALVYVEDAKGNTHECRALLDVGSQANFMTDETCNRLNLPRFTIETAVGGLGRVSNPVKARSHLTIRSKCKTFRSDLSCLVIKNITEEMPNIPLNRARIPIPPGVTPSDPLFDRPGQIDLLIGAGLFWKLLCVGQHKLGSGDLVWQKTRLGWVLGGSLNWSGMTARGNAPTCHTVTITQLQQDMTRFWEIEDADLAKRTKSNGTTDECETLFKSTTTRNNDGRYVVTIPFNDKRDELGESRSQAERRLLSMERKLSRDPRLREQYVTFMQEYEALGHMSQVPNELPTDFAQNYYLPHHAVFKETSTTTKIRVVFDGSAKTSSGNSLNDAQLVGSNVQSDLISILIRFRKHRVVLSADIEKMYRQILVRKEDRRFQRILWRNSRDMPIKTYELNTVTYGTAAAAFLATRVLRQIGENSAQSHSLASRVIINDFYVDDLLTGCESIAEAATLREDLTRILAQAGLPLTKWASNDPRISSHNSKAETVVKIKSSDKDPKTLGLLWSTETDELRYSTMGHTTNRITKRTILSETAKIFDPLGLICPVIVRAKIIMQQLWQLQIGWDESLPQELHTIWMGFRAELDEIAQLTIPRRVLITGAAKIELHGFSDASEKAYGAAVYLRSYIGDGTPAIRLVSAKSRVAPIKTVSLPRLELCGALMLAQLADKIKDALQLNLTREYYWTDSTIVLAWLKGQPTRWKTFVANRVSEIQRLTPADSWNHVLSPDNPADLASRGASPSSLKGNNLWWSGPSWLAQHPNHWPVTGATAKTIPEARQMVVTCMVTSDADSSCRFDLSSRFSSYPKTLRVTAYCLRFAKGLLARIRNGQRQDRSADTIGAIEHTGITAQELDNAEIALIKVAQKSHFAPELKILGANKPLGNQSKLVSLNPFLDSRDVIRVGGRLENAPLDYSKKHPAILPARDSLTELIIRHEHQKLLHAGCQHTLASLHNRFWIINGRRQVKRVLHGCVRCFRLKPTSPPYLMADLPADRLTPARAFTTCGVDYAGPFLTKEKGRSRALHKSYICIFICFVTKAVHIELATDLSTDAFLNCLHRFISRRGRCHSIHSDNGRNFIGARNKLNELGILLNSSEHNNRIQAVLSEERMQWHLIPPQSPHFGGLWESAVKSAKFHLKRVIGDQRLSFEELYTILTQVEACLNSRPLYPLSSDPKDLTPLSPGHFLIGDAMTALPQPDLTELNQSRLNRYQLIQQTIQHFWKRWHQEYLHGLQQRHKWKLRIPGAIKIGALVTIRDDNLPPLRWRLGRIEHLHAGTDNVIRVVSLKVAEGFIKRPVTKICLLPDSSEDETS